MSFCMKTFIRCLDDECKNTLSNVINSFCDVSHPNANKNNLELFSSHCVVECMVLATCSETHVKRNSTFVKSIRKINDIIIKLK